MSSVPTEASARRLRALEALVSVGVIDWSARTGATDCSEGARALLAPLPERGAASARDLLRRLTPVARRTLMDGLRAARRGDGISGSLACCVETREGRELDCRFGVSADESPPWGLTIALRDATKERATERRLGERAESAHRMLEMASVGTWSVDVASSELSWSDEVFRIHELPIGETPRVEDALGFYPPEASAQVEAGLEGAVAGKGPYDLELPLITSKGRRVWVHARGDVERDAHGEPVKIYGIFRNVTKRHEAESKLRESEERLTLALEGARDGVWDWNLETNAVHFSARWKELVGYEDDEIEHDLNEWATRVPEEDRERALASVAACIRGEVPEYRAEFRMRHKDGSWRWILARAQVISRDGSGNAQRMVGTHSDITEQVELRRELVAAKESAEAAAKAKSSFLATMSHEIRTPMNGVLGLTRELLESELDDDQRKYAESIYGSGSSLLAILNDILDLSKAEAGMLELESIPMDPARCASEVIELLRGEARAKQGLALGLEVDDDVPPCVHGDPSRIRQVLLNLVGNAIKFTPAGRVDVRLSMHEDEAGASRLRMAVHDTGIGIDPAARERLFEAFTQADASTTRCFGGTGLGLSICRHLAQRMNGVLDCGANAGGGSIFWVEIPVTVAKLQERGGTGNPGFEFDADGSDVLVVEDNEVNQLVSRKMLERLGFRVSIAVNGEEALERTEGFEFAFVFMDCQMPVMDGFEASRLIRERASARGASRVPIIAMTANALAGDQERCLAAGMDDYVVKPIVREELVAAIRRALTGRAAA